MTDAELEEMKAMARTLGETGFPLKVEVLGLIERLALAEAVCEAARLLRIEIQGMSQWAEVIARDIGWTNWNVLMTKTDAIGDTLAAWRSARSAEKPPAAEPAGDPHD